MLKIRRPLGRLIFNMGIAIPGKTVFLIETAPWSSDWDRYCRWHRSIRNEATEIESSSHHLTSRDELYGTGNCLQHIWHLAYRGRSNLAANYQTKYQNWFSCVKIVILYIKFRWSLFSRVQSSIKKKASISSNSNLALTRHQGIVWTNDGLNYSHTHALLSLNWLHTP